MRINAAFRRVRVQGSWPRARRAWRRPPLALVGAAIGALALGLIVGLIVAPGPAGPPNDRAAAFVPADALAYVNISLDRRRPSVRRALTLVGRLPALGALARTVRARVAASISPPGATPPLAADVRPWLGDEVAFAVLNTPGTVAGSLILAASRERVRTLAFLSSSGARDTGSYRR